MGDKDIYIERLSQQLDQWKAEILELEHRAEDAGGAVQEQSRQALEALKGYYDATEGNVEDWIESSDDTWDMLEDMVDQKMEVAAAAMKQAINQIRMMLG